MTKQERIIEAMVEWMTEEYGEETAPVELEGETGVYSLAETNAEYDDNLAFGVNINVNKPSITWYVERFGKWIWCNEKTFNDDEELITFMNQNDFEEITGDEYYEDGGYSKYKGEKVELIKVVVLVTPKSISEDAKSKLKEEYDVSEVFVFGNGTDPLKQLLDALKAEDPYVKSSCAERMLFYINRHFALLGNGYYSVAALFCDGAGKGELSSLVMSDEVSPDTLGTITEDVEFKPVLEAMSLFD